MTLLRYRTPNPGRQSCWLQHRSRLRMTTEPCRHCDRDPVLGDYIWRQVGVGHYCQACAVDHLGVPPRLAGHAPVTVIDGGDL